MPSPEARFAVYLVDPGQDRAGILGLLQEVLGLEPDGAAELLRHFPSLVSFVESEAAARRLIERFRQLDAVAVVRPADQPLAPAPVEEVDASPAQRASRIALLVLGVVQVGVSVLWFRQGYVAAAVFGMILALYVLLYFGPRRR